MLWLTWFLNGTRIDILPERKSLLTLAVISPWRFILHASSMLTRCLRYFGLITKVLPPASIRESADAQDAQLHQPISQPKASTSILNPAPRENFDYDSVSHKVGCNLNIPADEAESQDNADEYVYIIQLMDADHKFEGSSMELKFKSLRSVFLILVSTDIY